MEQAVFIATVVFGLVGIPGSILGLLRLIEYLKRKQEPPDNIA